MTTGQELQGASAEQDLEAVVVPGPVKVAGGIFVLTGVFTALIGLQIWANFVVRGAVQLVAPTAVAFGVGAVVLGAGVARARSRAALLGLILAVSIGCFALFWVGFAFMNGVLSMLAVAVLPLSGLSALLIGLSRKQVQRIDEARARLRAQGLDAGL